MAVINIAEKETVIVVFMIKYAAPLSVWISGKGMIFTGARIR